MRLSCASSCLSLISRCVVRVTRSILCMLYVGQAKDIQFEVQGCAFIMHANPYFLRSAGFLPLTCRLTFPHELLEEEEKHTATFDYGSGTLAVHLRKAQQGLFFEGLDMLTKLLEKRAVPT